MPPLVVRNNWKPQKQRVLSICRTQTKEWSSLVLPKDVVRQVRRRAGPARAHIMDGPHTVHMHGSMFNLSENFRLDAVDQPVSDGKCRVLDDEKNGERDDDAD